MFELFWVKCLLRLGPMFENVLVYSLIEIQIIFKNSRVDSVFSPNFVLNSKLRVIPYLLHLPFLKAHVVVCKGLLAEKVAGRHLEDLFVEVLFLNRNLEL